MTLPALTQFLTHFPSYSLSTPFKLVLQSLEQEQTGVISHIIIVDSHQRPIGAIPVLKLWSILQAVDRGLSAAAAAAPWDTLPAPLKNENEVLLANFQELMQPIVQVMADQTIQDLWGAIRWTEQSPLVVVNDQMQYIGVLNPAALLNWLPSQVSLGRIEDERRLSEVAPEAPAAGSASRLERSWLMELSHALKTPMTSLLGLSTLLLDSRVGPLNERQTRYVGLVRQSVRRLIRMINQLLDWLRLESDQMALTPTAIDTRRWMADLASAFLNEFPDIGTPVEWADRFRVNVQLQPPQIVTDTLRLKQSLHYIMEYLLLAGSEPQGIEVSPWGPWIGLTLWNQAQPVALPLLMRGLGLHTLPQRGESEHNLLDTLGMVLACRLIDLQGGEITYLASSRFGNRITLLLPRDLPPAALASSESPATAPAVAGSAADSAPASTVLVLLVSDHTALIDRVYDSLQSPVYRLVIARNRNDAQAKWQRLKPDLLILDAESIDGASEQVLAAMGTTDQKPIVVIDTVGAAAHANLGIVIAPERLSQELLPLLNQLQQVAETQSTQPPPRNLTLLLLRPQPVRPPTVTANNSLQSLYAWLQQFHCRLLQVDDLTQATLLSRVWRPDAIIIDATLPVSEAYLTELSQLPELARHPLITLTPYSTELAHIVPGLWIVACPEAATLSPRQGAITLLQVITTVTDLAESSCSIEEGAG